MTDLTALLEQLPELYQPLYGHPELSTASARQCSDRLAVIVQAHDALHTLLQRPLRVLDLGCAQGFFSLSLAERGAEVWGIDQSPENIAVCQALAQAAPELSVHFECDRIEHYCAQSPAQPYDLVLGLSVLHHLIHAQGWVSVQQWLTSLSQQAGLLLLELALQDEPLYWGSAQPESPQALLADIAFVRELARYPTHLSAIERPMYVASQHYWWVGDQMAAFEHWRSDPHALAQGAHADSRRYFFSADRVLKLYRLTGLRADYNRQEFQREQQFLAHPPADFPVIPCYGLWHTATEAWVLLQRQSGILLLDALQAGHEFDRRAVMLGVLQQLAQLQAAGWYHNDLRTWNIMLLAPDQPLLIDYGAISRDDRNHDWPEHPVLALVLLIYELTTGEVEHPEPLRRIAISPYQLPEPYRSWLLPLWSKPCSAWRFATLAASLAALEPATLPTPPVTAQDEWSAAIEQALQTQKQYMQALRHDFEHHSQHTVDWLHQQIRDAQHQHSALEQRAAAAEAWGQELEQHVAALKQHSAALEQRAVAAEAWGQELESTLQHLYRSRSWRLTAPLRRLSHLTASLQQVYIARRASLRTTVVRVLSRYPRLYVRVAALYRRLRPRRPSAPPPATPAAPPNPQVLSVRAQRWQQQLQHHQTDRPS